MAVFTSIAWVSLGIAFLCALVIAIDAVQHPQRMWIMNLVWPITALYLSVFALWGYFRISRGMTKDAMHSMSQEHMQHQMTQGAQASRDPTWRQIAISDSHCGAGCVLGDIIAEFGLFAFGWTLFGQTIYAEYAGDLLLAWLFGSSEAADFECFGVVQ